MEEVRIPNPFRDCSYFFRLFFCLYGMSTGPLPWTPPLPQLQNTLSCLPTLQAGDIREASASLSEAKLFSFDTLAPMLGA